MDNYIITISRRFASKGHEIAGLVGSMLEIPVYDRSQVEARVQTLQDLERPYEGRGQVPERFHEEEEKERDAGKERMKAESGGRIRWKGFLRREANPEQKDEALLEFERQSAVIRSIAEEGPCIILGRCADQIFENHPRALHIFIYASVEERTRNIMQMLHTDEESAKALLLNEDRARDAYRRRFSAHPEDELSGRHILIDSGKLGVALCADLLVRSARELFLDERHMDQ
jgi:cytidylate kinase